MGFGERLKLAVAGLGAGIWCGLVVGIVVCAFGGMVLPKLHPALKALASTDLFSRIAFTTAGAGVVAGLAGQRTFDAFCRLAWGGSLSLGFGIAGLFAGAPLGFLLRLAGMTLGVTDRPYLSHAEHDILVGCAVGIVLGALSGLRLLIWPPRWFPGTVS